MEIPPGSTVTIMFTLSAYNLTDGAAMNYGVTSGITLNIQSVVLLADPLVQPSPKSPQCPPSPWCPFENRVI
jgi:hypothetical protein